MRKLSFHKPIRYGLYFLSCFLIFAAGIVFLDQTTQKHTKAHLPPYENPNSDFISETYFPFYHDTTYNLLVNQYPDMPLVLDIFGSGGGSTCGIDTSILISYRGNTVNIRYLGRRVEWREIRMCPQLELPFRYLIPLDVTLLSPGEITVNLMDQVRTAILTEEMIAAAKPIQMVQDPSAFTITNVEIIPDGISENVEIVPDGVIDKEAGIRLTGWFKNYCVGLAGFVQYFKDGQIVLTPITFSAPNTCPEEQRRPLFRMYGIDLSYLPASLYDLKIGDLTLEYWLGFGVSRPLPPTVPASDATPPNIPAAMYFPLSE